MQLVLDLLEKVDIKATAINISLCLLLLKAYFCMDSRIDDIASDVSTLKEKAYNIEKDIIVLEKEYGTTNTELRYYLKYNDGKILTS